MTTIVVGGHSRNVGKTSVTAGIIKAFARYPWTAIKLSSHWHTESPGEDICAIREESDREGESDSSRFLAAGATRSFWIRVREGRRDQAMPELLPVLQSSPFVIIESNWILQHLRPDLSIMVLRYDVQDFKESARATIGRAGALVVVTCASPAPPWEEFVRETATGVPLFTTPDPLILPPGLLDLVQSRIRDSRLEIRD